MKAKFLNGFTSKINNSIAVGAPFLITITPAIQRPRTERQHQLIFTTSVSARLNSFFSSSCLICSLVSTFTNNHTLLHEATYFCRELSKETGSFDTTVIITSSLLYHIHLLSKSQYFWLVQLQALDEKLWIESSHFESTIGQSQYVGVVIN